MAVGEKRAVEALTHVLKSSLALHIPHSPKQLAPTSHVVKNA